MSEVTGRPEASANLYALRSGTGAALIARPVNDTAARLGGVIAVASVPILIGPGGGNGLAGALVHGYRPAMLTLAGLCVAAAVVTALFVSDTRTGVSRTPAHGPTGTAPWLRTAARQRVAREGGGMTTTLTGQTVVLLGGSAGIGLETARLARTEGAEVVLVGRDPDRLKTAAEEVGARSTAAFDATDVERLDAFFAELPDPIDHVLVTAGRPYYGKVADLDLDDARRHVSEHLLLPLYVGRATTGRLRPDGSLIFMGGTGARRPGVGLALASTLTMAFPALVASMALELAPTRVNLIAAGFVDTPLSAQLLGDDLEKRREELRHTLPIGRVVGPADVAALAVHLMTNTALTGATYDIDGGQQLVARS